MVTDRVTVSIETRQFEIKVERKRGRKPWTYRWCELRPEKPPSPWSFDPFDELRFKTADDAIEAAVREIYRGLANSKLEEIFTQRIVFGAP